MDETIVGDVTWCDALCSLAELKTVCDWLFVNNWNSQISKKISNL